MSEALNANPGHWLPATVWLRARHLASLSLFLVYKMHIIPVGIFSTCGYLLLVSPREMAKKVGFMEMVTTYHTLLQAGGGQGTFRLRARHFVSASSLGGNL